MIYTQKKIYKNNYMIILLSYNVFRRRNKLHRSRQLRKKIKVNKQILHYV